MRKEEGRIERYEINAGKEERNIFAIFSGTCTDLLHNVVHHLIIVTKVLSSH
jgi:hypothetical protein